MLLALDTPDVEGAAASEQGGQSAEANGLLEFVAALDATQGGQSVDALAGEVFGGAVVTAQASATADASAILECTAAASSGQGAQSAAADGFQGDLNFGSAETGQGEQSAAGEGAVSEVPQADSGGYVPRTLGVRIRRGALRIAPRIAAPPPVHGVGDCGQGAQASSARGTVTPPQKVSGAASSEQPLAEVIAIGAVDNRRPRNLRKKKLAAAALLAA